RRRALRGFPRVQLISWLTQPAPTFSPPPRPNQFVPPSVPRTSAAKARDAIAFPFPENRPRDNPAMSMQVAGEWEWDSGCRFGRRRLKACAATHLAHRSELRTGDRRGGRSASPEARQACWSLIIGCIGSRVADAIASSFRDVAV